MYKFAAQRQKVTCKTTHYYIIYRKMVKIGPLATESDIDF